MSQPCEPTKTAKLGQTDEVRCQETAQAGERATGEAGDIRPHTPKTPEGELVPPARRPREEPPRGKDVWGPYYDDAKRMHDEHPEWLADPDRSTVVAGEDLKAMRSDYEAKVRNGALEPGHHRQGLAFGGTNTPDNIQPTGEHTIRASELDGVDLGFYSEAGYGKNNPTVLKTHQGESGILEFGNNPMHTTVTALQNQALAWQRPQGLR